MKFSVTTLIGYIRLIASVAICGKPIYDYWTITNYNAVSEAAGAAALTALVQGAISAFAGHFTADSPPSPKTGDLPVPPSAATPAEMSASAGLPPFK